MKNKKNKELLSIIFVLFFLVGTFLFETSKALAVENQQACSRSGGTWDSSRSKCACPTGKSVLSTTGDCGDQALVAENNLTTGTPNDPNWSQETTGIYGRTSETTTTTENPRQFKYQLLEQFPGFFNKDQVLIDFPQLILSIYKFGIWTVGIAGLFMLVVGGFTYMTSAGNTSTAGSGKKIITDALFGIVAALAAYLILYVINPDLTRITIGDTITSVDVTEVGPGPSTSGSGNCKPITDPTNACNVDRLKFFVINKGYSDAQATDWATKASSICNAESGGKASAESGGKCGGTPIAYGLFQINLNAWCKGAFTNKWSKSAGFTDGGCTVKDVTIFNNCKKNATDPTWNIEKMWQLYQKSNWKPWEVTLNGMCPKW